jgi:pilus assembly protein Flp/PilA
LDGPAFIARRIAKSSSSGAGDPLGKEVKRMSLLRQLSALVNRVRRADDGQGLAEYALILALIAIVAIVALIFLGSQISDKLSVIGSQLDSVSN